jgi:hypothetical protein
MVQQCLARWLGILNCVGSDLSCYWLITESGKIISKTSVEHVIRHDYIDQEKKKLIDEFNTTLTQNLNEENFQIEGDGDYRSCQLLDINDDYNENTGIECNPGLEPLTPMDEDYDDMLIGEQLEADDEEAVDKYLAQC